MSDQRRAPVFNIEMVERNASEPEWSVSALDVAVLEADVNPFDPVVGPYAGLRQRPSHDGPDDIGKAWPRNTWWIDMRRWSPPVTFLAWLAMGVGLLLLSVLRKVAFVERLLVVPGNDTISREVGFVWSPAWSVGCLVLAPFAAYLMVSALQWLPDILEEMRERGMLATWDYQLLNRGADVTRSWRVLAKARTAILVMGAVVIFVLVVFPLGPRPGEFWSWRNEPFFYLVARIWAAIFLMMFFNFIVYVADFTRLLYKPAAFRNGNPKLCRWLPDLSSSDVRRGFELFEGVLHQLLMIGGIVFVACNLARTDATYLAGSRYSNIWEFSYEFLSSGMKNPGDATLHHLVVELWLDLRSILLTLGASLTFLIGYLGLAGAIQDAAVRSARNARDFYRTYPNASLSGYPAQAERDALAKMKMRPLLFPTPYLLISLFTIGLLSILFYQVGLYLFGITLVVMFATVIIRFIRRK